VHCSNCGEKQHTFKASTKLVMGMKTYFAASAYAFVNTCPYLCTVRASLCSVYIRVKTEDACMCVSSYMYILTVDFARSSLLTAIIPRPNN